MNYILWQKSFTINKVSFRVDNSLTIRENSMVHKKSERKSKSTWKNESIVGIFQFNSIEYALPYRMCIPKYCQPQIKTQLIFCAQIMRTRYFCSTQTVEHSIAIGFFRNCYEFLIEKLKKFTMFAEKKSLNFCIKIARFCQKKKLEKKFMEFFHVRRQ